MASSVLAIHRSGKPQAERRFYERSFGNPSAQLYRNEDNTLCCGVRDERANLLRELWRKSLFDSLVKQGYLAPFEAVSGTEPDYSLVLRLVRTPRISYCNEWSTLMWRAACLRLLPLTAILVERGLTLRYPHSWHLSFHGPKPAYAQPGSIVLLDPVTFRGAFDRVSQFFLRPLALAATCATGLAGRFLRRANLGVELCFGGLQAAYDLYIAELETLAPAEFLNRRLQEVQDLIIPGETPQWSGYQADLPFKRSDAWHQKQYGVHGVLQELGPRLVLDLASNLGSCTRLAAIEGVDDEVCVNRMYSIVREEHSGVLPLVVDVTDPAPGGGVANAWFPPATALAIVHHLLFGTHRLVMSEIVTAFASFARGARLLKLIPMNSPGRVYSEAHRTEAQSWYKLGSCVGSQRHVFKRVDMLPAVHNSRRLLPCEK
jgi:hypothetical protein